MFIKTHEVSKNDPIITKVPVIIRVMGALSVHDVEVRTSKEDNEYYLFYHLKGTCVTNYCKDDFIELNKVLPIDKESIFLWDDRSGILPVSEDYRY